MSCEEQLQDIIKIDALIGPTTTTTFLFTEIK